MAKVFVLNNSGHDLEDAKKYGILVDITSGNAPLLSTDRMKREIKHCLDTNKFNPKTDYIVPSGSVILGLLLGMIVGEMKGGPIKLLIWDAKNRCYLKRDIY